MALGVSSILKLGRNSWDWEEDARWGEVSAKAGRAGWTISDSFLSALSGALGTKQRIS